MNAPSQMKGVDGTVHSIPDQNTSTSTASASPRPPRIATIVVTWNRRDSLLRALAAHAAQHTDLSRIDMIVVDNASTDATLGTLLNTYHADLVIENHGTDLNFDFRSSPAPSGGGVRRVFEADGGGALNAPPRGMGLGWVQDAPDQQCQGGDKPAPHLEALSAADSNAPHTSESPPPPNSPHPFRSLTILRNLENRGGTGGFNAGMAFARDVLDSHPADPIDFVWLLDDDAFVDTDTLSLQLAAMNTDPRIAMVGARSVDPDDRSTTLESTVYFDWHTGHLMDDAPPNHPYHPAHRRFLSQVGSTRRGSNYSGLVDCDVCAAASLLARMSVLREIGLWNPIYFIYEDDADWCLRARHAGHRVVACMDAKVFHRTWHARLSPRLNCIRMFYVSRNRLWTMADVMDEPHRSHAIRDWHRTLLRFALDAAWHRRATHAQLLLRALRDSLRNIGGRCPIDIPREHSTADALRAAGAFKPNSRVAILCDRPLFADFAADMRSKLRDQLQPGEHEPHWIELARNDLPLPPPTSERVLYSKRLRSKIRRQPNALTALIVFDSAGDFPLLSSCPTIHIDGPTNTAFIEHDPLPQRLAFTFRWLATALQAWWSRLTPPPKGRGPGRGFSGRSTTQHRGTLATQTSTTLSTPTSP